jgi:hypothetical protein
MWSEVLDFFGNCNLKNGKSPGLDMIGNELLKTAQTYFIPCLVKLFNAVLESLLSSNILLDYSIEKYLVCLLFVA